MDYYFQNSFGSPIDTQPNENIIRNENIICNVFGICESFLYGILQTNESQKLKRVFNWFMRFLILLCYALMTIFTIPFLITEIKFYRGNTKMIAMLTLAILYQSFSCISMITIWLRYNQITQLMKRIVQLCPSGKLNHLKI